MLLSVDPATHKRCKSVIAMFMSFVHGRLPGSRCNPDHNFTDAELTAVTPLDVCRFGAEFPSQMQILLQLDMKRLPLTKRQFLFYA